MSALPVLSGGEVVKVLEKIGYVLDRQRGSHVILRQQKPPHRRLTIPDHKEVAKDLFRNKWRIWRGEDKTGKEGEAGVLDYTSMQPDAVQSPPQLPMNRPVIPERVLRGHCAQSFDRRA